MREAAIRKTDSALEKLVYYEDVPQMKKCLPALVHPTQAVQIVVDAATSKQRVFLEMLDGIVEVVESLSTKKVCLLVPTGSRVEILGTIKNKCVMTWSRYGVQLRCELLRG